jgi:iron-sulfur cluster repair protein YtfE (RIC family)
MSEDRQELFNKLLELEKRLARVTADKKSMAADYRDQINDIKDEIKETVTELEGVE